MKDINWEKLAELIFVTANRLPFPMEFKNRGIFARKPGKDGHLGGNLSLLHSSEHQLSFDTEEVRVIAACQHVIKPEDVFGHCLICGGFTCNREECFVKDELLDIYICRSDAVKIGKIYTSKLAKNTDELYFIKALFLSITSKKELKN
jgi:hypothetical protein